MLLWQYVFAPLLYPILALPQAVLLVFIRPLQPSVIIAITAFYFWASPLLALAPATAFLIYYTWHVLTPPREGRALAAWLSTYSSPGARGAALLLTYGLIGFFAVLLIVLPGNDSLGRWFRALALGYYLGGVLAGFFTAVAVGRVERATTPQ